MYKWLERQVNHVNAFYDDPDRLRLLSPWDCPPLFRADLLDGLKFIAKNCLEVFYFHYNGYDFSIEIDEDIFNVYLIDHNDGYSFIPIVRSSYIPDFLLNNSNEYFIGSFRNDYRKEKPVTVECGDITDPQELHKVVHEIYSCNDISKLDSFFWDIQKQIEDYDVRLSCCDINDYAKLYNERIKLVKLIQLVNHRLIHLDCTTNPYTDILRIKHESVGNEERAEENPAPDDELPFWGGVR